MASGEESPGAREYDARTGRFLSVDPVLDASNPQSLNVYGYAGNSPVTFSDPTGEWWDPGDLIQALFNLLTGNTRSGGAARDDCRTSACPDGTALYCQSTTVDIGGSINGSYACPTDDTNPRYQSLDPPMGTGPLACVGSSRARGPLADACHRYKAAIAGLDTWHSLACWAGSLRGKDTSLSCPLMEHYMGASGADWEIDFDKILGSPEFTDSMSETMSVVSGRAIEMCQQPPCTYTFDSGWVPMEFQEGFSDDLYFGFRGMTYRATGMVTVHVGADGEPYTTASYTVTAYKAWNFDRNESLSSGPFTFPFAGASDAAGYGLAQEFAVVSQSGILTYDSRV